MPPILRLFHAAVVFLALSACVDTHRLPKLPQYGDDYYPGMSRRIGEEGRVLVEFHLNRRGQLTANPTVSDRPWQDANARIKEGAIKLVKTLPSRIDPANHFKPDPKRTYGVTVIFCLDPPGNCEKRFLPFENTTSIVVKAQRPHIESTIREFWQQN